MHEEMPKRGPEGTVYGFQLWVNLPAAEKMGLPRYQEVSSDTIPIAGENGSKVRVVAGQYEGVTGPVTEIAAQPLYMDVTLKAGEEFSLPVPLGHTVVAYVFEGRGLFGDGVDQIVESVRMLTFGDGDLVLARAAPNSHVRFMLIAGAPIGEPIVPYGPFVMNTEAEIMQAMADLRNGTFVQN
jgi:hypothetical protein